MAQTAEVNKGGRPHKKPLITAEELAANPVVREKYLGRDFELRRRVFDTPNQ